MRPAASNAAGEALELAEEVGLFLDQWQLIGLEAMLGEDEAGKWAAFETAIVVARQNGKGGILEARELAGLFLFDEMDIVHSAHEAKTSKEAFRRMERYIRSSPTLFARVGDEGFKRSNEEVSITVRDTGARLRYLTRSTGGGRGFTADVLVLDEAYNLPAEMMAAILPIISARPNPQVIYTSSAGLSSSIVLWGLRKRAMRGGDESLAYCEWTAERPSFDDKGRVVSPPVDPDDLRNWLLSNPSVGVGRDDGSGLSVDAIAKEQRAMSATPEMFLRERLGVWDPLAEEDAREPKLPQAPWKASAQPGVSPDGALMLAFDVDIDGASASIGVSSGSLAAPVVELVDYRHGTLWLPHRLVDLVEKHGPAAVGCNGAGPAGAQVGAVLMAFKDAGIALDVKQLNGQEYQQACGGFYTDVNQGRLRRPEGQQPLDLAGEDATERPLAEAWVWARRQATVPISPLVAVTIARALLPTEQPKPPAEADFIVI